MKRFYCNTSTKETDDEQLSIEEILELFEEERYNRVKKIWDWEWQQATNFYKTKKLVTPTDDYLDWLMNGV
jgi:hypothetical protein